MLSSLARLHSTLVALDHPGLHVRAWDPDIVTDANLGRQLFSPADRGQHKATVLITRINRYFGLNWEAYPRQYHGQKTANILITCVDTAAARVTIAESLKEKAIGAEVNRQMYWLDLGNLQKSGQVILGTIPAVLQPKSEHTVRSSLPHVVKFFPGLKKMKDKDQGPSCSLAEAIKKQDLYINSTIAQFGSALLWKLFREGFIRHHGCFINLDTLQVNPIPIK
jgi:PRTRC genetic system ThiF family protein